jgi:2,4-didehydro-3-deoxy-L-rhamnonate hydrolase
MKLIRFGDAGQEKPGIIHNDRWLDMSPFVEDYNEAFFENDGLAKLEDILTDDSKFFMEIPQDTRLGTPVARPSKIVCIGLNFRDHAIETGSAIPTEPILFFKSTTALCGPNDKLIIPRNSHKTDWEVELTIIIGKKTSYVSETEALDYVAGYALMNDYSERAFQKERGGQFCKGKGCDTFAPLGPFLATKDEISDVQNLSMQLSVNGNLMQDGNTSDMIFDVPYLVSYISQFMTLLPGDIISTGTPAGVGAGIKPAPVFLKSGDVVEMKIEGLGESRQEVV